ncbi:hypothetical protein K432DRAFT_430261 [Lepidopterella palustris CBS 459.81]|uniref:Uncharacterized protein n=1 Tax=Lepidopterella palustris CBS 459.81 TaxID=1314670 RepID=A0A8E2DYK6_9PEZI|nr:hypothetical protein K432DRAFT_430261 [Lepidopterella palustris CBS 459.81]
MKTTILTAFILSALALPLSATPIRRQNLQPFTGALGGVAATPVLNSGNAARPFSVKGDTFVNIGAALQRSCDQQFNACANLANGGAAFSVSDCSAQKTQCTAADTGVTASPAAAAPVVSTTAAAAVPVCTG